MLHLYGITDLAHKLNASLMKYQITGNGFAEVASGEVVQGPPYHHIDEVVEEQRDDQILLESHDGPGYFSDWSGFPNLACMGVVNEN